MYVVNFMILLFRIYSFILPVNKYENPRLLNTKLINTRFELFSFGYLKLDKCTEQRSS